MASKSWRSHEACLGYIQGQSKYFGVYRSEAQARSEAIKQYNVHNETGPRAEIPPLAPLSPSSQPGSPLLSEAPGQHPAPSPALSHSKHPHSLSRGASAEELHSPMLLPPHLSARDPRRWAQAPPGSSARITGSLVAPPGHHGQREASPQQQEEQPQAQGMRGLPPSAGVAERGTPALPEPKMTASCDGRYQLPPRLRKADGRCWFRGYHARKVPGTPSSFSYGVDFQRKVLPPAAAGISERFAPFACC